MRAQYKINFDRPPRLKNFLKLISPELRHLYIHTDRQTLKTQIEISIDCNLVLRACDPWEGNEGSGIIRCRKPGILAKIELRIHFNGQSDSSLKRIIPEPSFPSQGSQARGTRLDRLYITRPKRLGTSKRKQRNTSCQE